MIRLTDRTGKTVTTHSLTPELNDKDILQHNGIHYIYHGRLNGDWIWMEATVGLVPGKRGTYHLSITGKPQPLRCIKSYDTDQFIPGHTYDWDGTAVLDERHIYSNGYDAEWRKV